MVARILTIVSCVFHLANCFSAPYPGFKPCKTDDEKCLLQNAENGVQYFADGIPALGVQQLDPGFYKKVDSSSPNLKFILSDVTIAGLKTCKPLKVKLNTAESNLVVQLECASTIDGDYEIDGQVLILKATGKGKIHVSIPKMISTVYIDYVIKDGKDGKKHIRIKKFNHVYELKEKSEIVLSGLFQDNAVLKQAVEDLIKNSGNEVIQEIGDKMIQVSVTRTVENFNKFFGKVDFNEITLQ